MSNNSRPHYLYNMIYPAIILLSCIILLITVKWATIPNLEKLISFGSTLTSLVLSLIVIVFAIFSNFSFSKSATSLQEASSKISETTEELKKATAGIKEGMIKIPSQIEGVERHVKESHETLMARLSEREELQPPPTPSTPTQEATITKLLRGSSYTGIVTLYACKMSKDTAIPFSLSDLGLGKEYSYGFMVACSAMGVISYTYKKEIFAITEIDENIVSHIETNMSNRLEDMSKQFPKIKDYKEREKERLKKLKEYFTEE